MLQLNKSLATNTVAFYPEVVTSASLVYFSGSQDYNRNTASFSADVISNYLTSPWVISQISGSSLPDASGFYTFNIYEYITGTPLIWDQVDVEWQLETSVWDSAAGFSIGDLLTTERAFNSGSDGSTFTQYVSSNENGYYTTYIG